MSPSVTDRKNFVTSLLTLVCGVCSGIGGKLACCIMSDDNVTGGGGVGVCNKKLYI